MTFDKLLSYLGEGKLGFFGAGHLAQAFLKKIIKTGFSKEKILICHKGSINTKDRLQQLNLSQNIVSSQRLAKESKVILYFVKPQDYLAAREVDIKPDTLILSFLAGIQIKKLKAVFGETKVIRTMPTTPQTIENKEGLLAVYPSLPEEVKELFDDLKIINLKEEEQMNEFVVLTCLPNILVYDPEIDLNQVMSLFGNLPVNLNQIATWAKRVAPKNLDSKEKQEFLDKVATKGGINEAVLKALANQKSPREALIKGIKKNKKLNQT